MSNPPRGPMDPSLLAGILIPKPYQNIAELLGILGQLLIFAERSQDERLKGRYIKLFDIMLNGLTLYMDKEFYQSGPNNVLSLNSKISSEEKNQASEDDNPLIFTNNPDNPDEEGPEAS